MAEAHVYPAINQSPWYSGLVVSGAKGDYWPYEAWCHNANYAHELGPFIFTPFRTTNDQHAFWGLDGMRPAP